MVCSCSVTMVQNKLGEITLAKKPTAECKIGNNKEDYCCVILDFICKIHVTTRHSCFIQSMVFLIPSS